MALGHRGGNRGSDPARAASGRITPASWRLLAIFAATIVGSIVRPAPASSIVLFGVTAIAITGTMTPVDALKGYADPIVWMVLCAFFISRAVIQTGLGRRIAFLFIRTLGKRSLGLSYALVSTDAVLASFVPSNGARAGGVIFPVVKSLAVGVRLRARSDSAATGGVLMFAVYQCDVVYLLMYLTGQASNVLIAKFAFATAGVRADVPPVDRRQHRAGDRVSPPCPVRHL